MTERPPRSEVEVDMTQSMQVALVIYNLQLQLGNVLVVIPLVPGGRVGSELMSSDLGQGRPRFHVR
jgi:hypothetical protein